ncbi:BtrG-like protein [Glarea lozoyensis ATCC 20868]|uniref:Putative gamma-glutamylcyclotransferase n=1 Tax=Glarea lozoyensis (strain ATCC 20868 / MF5171) TaxID=1116229 RepID=S3DYA6_GLAL2|nr:BtrG-like protein [Glarea lozoyensis ATCC 20868]EPE31308.1 BtrG-like protein [Glarea lozoyensis ATCC 20868]
MDSFSGSSSAAKIVDDDNKKQIYSPPTGKPPSDHKANRNIMLEKFQANAKPSLGQYTYIPKPFFFYGSLTDPQRLQEVLQLPTPPALKPARVKSYKIMLWGQYPALVDGPTNSYVDGMACVVETEKQQEMLEHYETTVYSVEGIRITIEGEEVAGRTFMWAGDPTELMGGTWSLEEWENGVEEEMASHFRALED